MHNLDHVSTLMTEGTQVDLGMRLCGCAVPRLLVYRHHHYPGTELSGQIQLFS